MCVKTIGHCIDLSSTIRFDVLVEKVETLFGTPIMKLQYKDEVGDLINLQTDDEVDIMMISKQATINCYCQKKSSQENWGIKV